MSNFKFLQRESQTPIIFLTNNIIRFNPDNVEFCFQFDDEDPIIFATGPNECNININLTRDRNITFTNNHGRRFKLFAREREI